MKTPKIYWLIIVIGLSATMGALCTVGLLFWHQLPSDGMQLLGSMVVDYFAYFFTAGFIILIAVGFAADWIFRAYVIPINQLAEQVDLINRINPEHRVAVNGSRDVRRLAKIINNSAEIIAEYHKNRPYEAIQPQCETETEKAILAALLSDLPQGILVCNLDGGIVFYNRKVKDLLLPLGDMGQGAGANGTQWVGLGRSIYRFIDRKLIEEVMDRTLSLLDEERGIPGERFLVGTPNTAVLPAEFRPILDGRHHVTGFIIYFEDLLAKMKQAEEESKHLQAWQHQLTQSISVIKAASELLQDETFKSDRQYHQMVQILGEQTDLAARLWTQKEIAVKWSGKPTWPLTPISVVDWSQQIVEKIAPKFELELHIDPPNSAARISIDIHQMSQSVITILDRVRRKYSIGKARAFVYQSDTWLYMDIVWEGQGIGDGTLKQWKTDCPRSVGRHRGLAIGDILAYHGIRLWPLRQTDQQDNAGIRLLIPAIDDSVPEDTNGRITILSDPRPEFYDFDLFHQAGQSPELETRQLSDLTYTVFDTETTGLDPSGGDEIISIGAMRIVNGRLLQEESFSQLIDPKRHLPWASVKYHGIRPEMLVDQPTIEQVLPIFKRYVRNTVLVGHNVAFDMRMLQVKEKLTGIRFVNPVLDTMLLSSLVHPSHENHRLNGVAQRVGVDIKDRHTALGDAAATGEIFIKLLPLLALKGIRTLAEAIEASKKSYYASLKY